MKEITIRINKNLTLQIQESPLPEQQCIITFYDKDMIIFKEVRIKFPQKMCKK